MLVTFLNVLSLLLLFAIPAGLILYAIKSRNPALRHSRGALCFFAVCGFATALYRTSPMWGLQERFREILMGIMGLSFLLAMALLFIATIRRYREGKIDEYQKNRLIVGWILFAFLLLFFGVLTVIAILKNG